MVVLSSAPPRPKMFDLFIDLQSLLLILYFSDRLPYLRNLIIQSYLDLDPKCPNNRLLCMTLKFEFT